MADPTPRELRAGPPRRPARWLPVACVLVLGVLAGAAEARIYEYVDRNGEAHYTDSLQQVPLEYLSQVRDISPEMAEKDGFRIVGGTDGPGDAGEDGDGFAPGAGTDPVDFDVDGAAAGDMVAGLLESYGIGLLILVLLAIPVLYVVSALIFKLACRIGGEDPPGLGRACGILLAQGFAGGAAGSLVSGIAMAMGIDESASLAASAAVSGSASLVSWMVNAAILSAMMSYGFVKSMWIGFLHTLLVIVMVGGPIGVIAGLAFLLA